MFFCNYNVAEYCLEVKMKKYSKCLNCVNTLKNKKVTSALIRAIFLSGLYSKTYLFFM